MRKLYDQNLGAIGKSFEDELVEALEDARIEVVAQVGKTDDPRAPADITVKIGQQIIGLQLETRDYELEIFSTIHLPDESLNFSLLIEKSKSGSLFVTPMEFIKYSPKIIVPNKYDGGKHESFYDIPIELFKTFPSSEAFCEWLKATYRR